ncbi:MAG: sigma-70 family RNA polymerase sigma factor [Planctomycetota bacterium]|nr:sigma-70 family RNA polymerase sigma factor [Planctomycetota bacterium]
MNRNEELRLIQKAAAGEKPAAEALIRAHQRGLFVFLVRFTGRPELAEDIVQEAFVRVLTNLDRFDPRFRFSTWLFTIAKRLCLNAMQKCKPIPIGDALEDGHGTIAVEPATRATRLDANTAARSALQEALLTLPLVQREIVILFHQQDWPIRVIAEHLNLPEGTVKSHLHRGRHRLHEVLTRQVSAADVRETFSFGEDAP